MSPSQSSRILHLCALFFAELFGTAVLVFVACFAGVDNFEGYIPTHVTMSVCSGLAPMISINIFGHISGAHVNPAVTVAAFICKLVDIHVSFVMETI
jgi:aquaporin related protein